MRLSKIYHQGKHKIIALDEINLIINGGEFVAITGASGSGKTTLMHLVGLLGTPTSGSLRINGSELSDLHPDQQSQLRNRHIGFVFQSYSLLARSTTIENVALPLIYAGVRRAERRERAMTALKQVGLADRSEHWPTQLSGGEQQRAAIARAYVTRPALILADEPTGALDSHTGSEIMQLFTQLNDSGTTIVLVTHDKTIARFASRQIQLKDGKIIADQISTAPSQ